MQGSAATLSVPVIRRPATRWCGAASRGSPTLC